MDDNDIILAKIDEQKTEETKRRVQKPCRKTLQHVFLKPRYSASRTGRTDCP